MPVVEKNSLYTAIMEIQDSLQAMQARGIKGFDCSPSSLAKLDEWGRAPAAMAETLELIQLDLGDCQRCKLARQRKNIVYGAGSPTAKLVFVGEGPGHEEDQQGLPFVGAAGQLLDRIIAAMKLSRDEVYICNIIKCRPPGNRNPEPDEIDTCYPFIDRQLAAIKPLFICALGKFAAQTLLKSTDPISRLRGRFFEYKGIQVMPTYHPAYLLRNPDKKRDVWNDMQLIMKEYAYED